MISLSEFFNATHFRISEGYDYQWDCYGPNAYGIDANSNPINNWSAGIIFDTQTQVVYEVTACDYTLDLAYRWINPDFKKAFKEEGNLRSCKDVAWDEVNYIDLDLEEDILEKVAAIVDGLPYDKRVLVSIDIEESLIHRMMELAHEKDVTLNQFVEEILRENLDNFK